MIGLFGVGFVIIRFKEKELKRKANIRLKEELDMVIFARQSNDSVSNINGNTNEHMTLDHNRIKSEFIELSTIASRHANGLHSNRMFSEVIRAILPYELDKTVPWTTKLWLKLKINHTVLSFFVPQATIGDDQRYYSKRWFIFFIEVLNMMFIDTLFVNYIHPISGSGESDEKSKQWLLSYSIIMTMVLTIGTLSKLCNIMIALLIKYLSDDISVESLDADTQIAHSKSVSELSQRTESGKRRKKKTVLKRLSSSAECIDYFRSPTLSDHRSSITSPRLSRKSDWISDDPDFIDTPFSAIRQGPSYSESAANASHQRLSSLSRFPPGHSSMSNVAPIENVTDFDDIYDDQDDELFAPTEITPDRRSVTHHLPKSSMDVFNLGSYQSPDRSDIKDIGDYYDGPPQEEPIVEKRSSMILYGMHGRADSKSVRREGMDEGSRRDSGLAMQLNPISLVEQKEKQRDREEKRKLKKVRSIYSRDVDDVDDVDEGSSMDVRATEVVKRDDKGDRAIVRRINEDSKEISSTGDNKFLHAVALIDRDSKMRSLQQFGEMKTRDDVPDSSRMEELQRSPQEPAELFFETPLSSIRPFGERKVTADESVAGDEKSESGYRTPPKRMYHKKTVSFSSEPLDLPSDSWTRSSHENRSLLLLEDSIGLDHTQSIDDLAPSSLPVESREEVSDIDNNLATKDISPIANEKNLLSRRERKSLYLLAARLVKLQSRMDESSPQEEVEMILSENFILFRSFPFSWHLLDQNSSHRQRTVSNASLSLSRNNHQNPDAIPYVEGVEEQERIRFRNMMENVRSVRRAEDRMVRELESIGSIDAQENYLMKRFLVEILPSGVQQRLGYMMMMSAGKACRDDWAESKRKRSTVLLACICLYILGAVVFILARGATMNRDYIGLWLSAFFIALTQDLIVVNPAVIWIHFLSIQVLLGNRIHNTIEELSARVDILKRRAMGVIKSQYMLVQHYNPVCRAARVVPHLTIARMLIALNDVDYLACEGNIQSSRSNARSAAGDQSNFTLFLSGMWLSIFSPIAQFKVAEFIIVLLLDLFMILLEWFSRM